MSEANQRKIRFSDAAFAIGLTNKALRNWLQRNEMKLVSDYTSRSWTEFTMADIAVLAVTERIVKFGFPVTYSNEIAHEAIFKNAGPMLIRMDRQSKAFTSVLQSWDIKVWKNFVGASAYSIISNSKPSDPPADTFLTLNVGKVVSSAFERLSDDSADDESRFYKQLLRLHHDVKSMADDIISNNDDDAEHRSQPRMTKREPEEYNYEDAS